MTGLYRHSIKRVPGKGRVALTFDDGPHPEYTPRLLETLAQLQVAATFFLTGSRVEVCPELVKDMIRNGHDVGNHTYSHRYPWLTKLGLTRVEWEKNQRLLEELTGSRIKYLRPPWGILTPASYRWVRDNGLLVLYAIAAGDWKKGMKTDVLIRQTLQKCCDGDIILLHDFGGAWHCAPEVTLAALPGIVAGIRSLGLEPVNLTRLLE